MKQPTDITGGCGCLVALIVGVPLLGFTLTIAKLAFRDASSWINARKEEKARQEESKRMQKLESVRIAQTKRRQNWVKRRQEAKDEKIQAFALKEAPKVWEVYQSLKSEIDVQSAKIEELRKSLESFGRSPEQDADFVRICALRDDMTRSRDALRTKLEDAYIAAKKYEAAPSRKDYQELHKKALEDGVLEADSASARFKEMRRNK